ncbi:dienelactone hydrolase family protein [Jiella sp. M17.18]|uniref:dienelactone hydrolase family protein n=1 Tax=Jiella sp. M17.18 TaxID=3234247 RepID=UPI0034DFFF22
MDRSDEPQITQAMIDAYDEYTHLTLDRRGFMVKLTGLAGSAAAAMAILPLIEASPAHAALTDPQDKRISSVWATFPAAGTELKSYVVKPARNGRFPSVLVIHENRGLNGHIEDVARRLALEGFLAVAPDFLSSKGGTPPDEDRARQLISSLDPKQTVAEAVAARKWLAAEHHSNRRVGAVGFCWGGGLVNQLAVADPELKAAVAYYGRTPDPAGVAKIKAAMLLHYAGLDERTNAGIPAFRKALEQAHVEHRIYVYDGANHAFNNDTSAARYDKAAAGLAWQRTIAFLERHLNG